MPLSFKFCFCSLSDCSCFTFIASLSCWDDILSPKSWFSILIADSCLCRFCLVLEARLERPNLRLLFDGDILVTELTSFNEPSYNCWLYLILSSVRDYITRGATRFPFPNVMPLVCICWSVDGYLGGLNPFLPLCLDGGSIRGLTLFSAASKGISSFSSWLGLLCRGSSSEWDSCPLIPCSRFWIWAPRAWLGNSSGFSCFSSGYLTFNSEWFSFCFSAANWWATILLSCVCISKTWSYCTICLSCICS